MIHGPSGSFYNYASCRNSDGKCTRKCPREFVSETITGSDGHPLYQRRSLAEGGFTAAAGRFRRRNPGLPCRAHIFSLPIHKPFPEIVQLAAHLQNEELRYFSVNTTVDVAETSNDTTLKAFFKLCQQNEFTRTLLYYDVPSFYVLTIKNTWARRNRWANVEGYPRVKKDATLGMVFTVPPSRQECFYLRLLLHETLPVVRKGTRADAIRACLKSSHLCPTVRPFPLTTMRAHLTDDVGSAEFSNVCNQSLNAKKGRIF
ncbi:unnamed protein product [Acanthosepion pharaonis]|uniref:Uncharacterized protein n=1 Tax=Acanthosepion pharaonis TaxID=158019 RepID=A0A812C205_ACAPH|nr:unnamed protein product [Sepia pharaonis]